MSQSATWAFSNSGGAYPPSNTPSAEPYCTAMEYRPSSGKHTLGVIGSIKWPVGSALTVGFFNGSPFLQQKVQRFASQWSQYANIKFQFGAGRNANIRVSFQAGRGSSTSYIGTGNKQVPSESPTMVLSLTDSSPDSEVQGITLHAFGHVLGCAHQHLQPSSPIEWNMQALMNDHPGWSLDMLNGTVVQKYNSHEVQASTSDPQSVMQYAILARWTSNGYSTNFNCSLSQMDKDYIREVYPFSSVPPPPPPVGPNPPVAHVPPRPVLHTFPLRLTVPELLSNGGCYSIVNSATSTFLDVSSFDNTSVQGYQNNGGYLNQKWTAVKSGNYWILQNARTRTYLTPSCAYSGSPVVVSPTQTAWSLTPLPGSTTFFTVSPAHNPFPSLNPLMLELRGSNSANGTAAILFSTNGGRSQIWNFILTHKGDKP